MEEKKIEDMNSLELKGILFNLGEQIKQIQEYANKTIVPLIEKKVKEEQEKPKS